MHVLHALGACFLITVALDVEPVSGTPSELQKGTGSVDAVGENVA
ncbi:hypothetical protein RSSM_03447 [Rhodopirellula sallentina SM41]|uniref:Uncharacterized protein n=1 Tax=Rhodopirellula sallentina SM41 TaxID=1263870 RepID=M5UGI4_9BACT|nr:hypothetical protein RSSM_03447 [Rhodopirellula sallentina SM41]